MELITVEPGTDLTNPWTASFIQIGNAWESFAVANHMQINGLLNPYGVKCNLVGSIRNLGNVEITVQKKLENVSTGVSLRASPYSKIIDLTCIVKSARVNRQFLIRKKGAVAWLVAKTKGLQKNAESGKLAVYTNHEYSELSISAEEFEVLSSIYRLNLKNRKLELKALSIPDEIDAIEEWFSVLESVLTSEKGKTVHSP